MISRILNASLFKNSGIYLIANILNMAIPFFLLPILTRFLTPLDYGLIATFQIIVNILIPIIGLSMNGAITRQYYANDNINFSVYLSNALILLLCTSFSALFIVLAFSGIIGDIIEFPSSWLWISVIVAVFQIINTILLAIWQVEIKPLKYSVFQNSQTFLNFALTILLVVFLEMKWQGRILSQLMILVIYGLMAIIILLRKKMINLRWNASYFRHIIRFGLPLIPYSFTGWIMLSVDRIFINNFVNVSETGLYSVAFQITLVIGILQSSFNNAWIPWLYDKLKWSNLIMRIKIVRFSYIYVFFNFCVAILISTLSPLLLPIIVGSKFYGITPIITWLAYAQASSSIHYMTVNYIFYHNKNIYLAYEAFIVAAIHIPLTYFFVKMNGALGAAQALLISNVLTSLLTFYFSTKVEKLPWLLRFSR